MNGLREVVEVSVPAVLNSGDALKLARELLEPGSMITIHPHHFELVQDSGSVLVLPPEETRILSQRLPKSTLLFVPRSAPDFAAHEIRTLGQVTLDNNALRSGDGTIVDPWILFSGMRHGQVTPSRLPHNSQTVKLINDILRIQNLKPSQSWNALLLDRAGLVVLFLILGVSMHPRESSEKKPFSETDSAIAIPQQQTRNDMQQTLSQHDSGTPENLECRYSGIETVFDASLESDDPVTGTMRDALLDPYQVSKFFLGNKFVYRGHDGDDSSRVLRFAPRGIDSGYFQSGGDKFRSRSTSLSDAINDILDYSALDDRSIMQWIVYTYQRSFSVSLSLDDMQIVRGQDKKVKKVLYHGELNPKVLVRVNVPVDGRDSLAANSRTTKEKFVPIISGKKLLLPVGISAGDGQSGGHDLRVPSHLLDSNKSFRLPVHRGPVWKLDASALAASLNGYRDRLKRFPNSRLESNFIDFQDPQAREATQHLVSRRDTPIKKAKKIISFVQKNLPYKSENDRDYDRPLLLVLFNGGGDCNNKIVAWASMMAAEKLDFCIVHCYDPKSDTNEAHVVGGVGSSVFPGKKVPKTMDSAANHALIELTAPGWKVGQSSIDGYIITGVEIFRHGTDGSMTIEQQ